MNTEATPETPASSNRTFLMATVFVVVGIFATSMPQPQVLGKIPLQHLLKAELHVKPADMAFFFLVCGLFWYIKPIAGILTDAFPLFGTKRKHYAVVSAFLAAVSWVALGFAPHQYGLLLIGSIVVNLFMVMLSTVTGAVLVEVGQSSGSVGRLTAVRQFVTNVGGMIQGPLGGFLATLPLIAVSGVNAAVLLVMVPVAWFILQEKKVKPDGKVAFQRAGQQIKTLSKTPTFWWALVFITLFYFAPGFGTLQFFRQSDVLKLDTQHIGYLQSIGGLGGILGAVAYGTVAKRLSLKVLLYFSIVVATLSTVIYLFYSSYALAMGIDFANGLFAGFAEVALIDLAARSTPAGCEGLGYSLMLSFRNVALFGADFLGSKFSDEFKWPWAAMVGLNAGSTFLVIFLLPFIPKIVMGSRDGVPEVLKPAN